MGFSFSCCSQCRSLILLMASHLECLVTITTHLLSTVHRKEYPLVVLFLFICYRIIIAVTVKSCFSFHWSLFKLCPVQYFPSKSLLLSVLQFKRSSSTFSIMMCVRENNIAESCHHCDVSSLTASGISQSLPNLEALHRNAVGFCMSE